MLPDYQAPCKHQEYHITHMGSVSVDGNSDSPHILCIITSFQSIFLGTLVPLFMKLCCFPTLFSTSGLFPSQLEAKRCAGAEKCAKALAESSRKGVETGIGKRNKGCCKGAKGGLYAAVGCLQ